MRKKGGSRRGLKPLALGLIAASVVAVSAFVGLKVAPGVVDRFADEVSEIDAPPGTAGVLSTTGRLEDATRPIGRRITAAVGLGGDTPPPPPSDELYRQAIEAHVRPHWSPPAGASAGARCVVLIEQTSAGHVENVNVRDCDGPAGSGLAVARAVLRSTPLPLPADYSVFARELEIELDFAARP